MSTLDLEALAEVARAASDGPWERGRFFWKIGSTRGMPDEFWVSVEAGGNVIASMPEEAAPSALNADHIATFDPPTVLALIEEVRTLRGQVARAEALADEWERVEVAEAAVARVEAAIRLVQPDHLTPTGARMLRKAIAETVGD